MVQLNVQEQVPFKTAKNVEDLQGNERMTTIDIDNLASELDNQSHEEFVFNYLSTVDISLERVLENSLFNPNNPRPLAIYLFNDKNVTKNNTQQNTLLSASVIIYLIENFSIWPWNLTSKTFDKLLSLVISHLGEEVTAIIDSLSNESLPLLCCLTFDRGHIKVACTIKSTLSDIEALAYLIEAHDAFKCRFEVTDTTGLHLTKIPKEDWLIAPSTLTRVPQESHEFRQVAADFGDGVSSIIRIDRIENITWLMQYLTQKEIVDRRIGHDCNEKLLFHGCPYSAAEQILQHGFNHNLIGINGSLYGRGFYFSNDRSICDQYAVPDSTTEEKRILMCRVLIGRSCQGNQSMYNCPSTYDSTIGTCNVHVVYSNRHVLPEYLITYK